MNNRYVPLSRKNSRSRTGSPNIKFEKSVHEISSRLNGVVVLDNLVRGFAEDYLYEAFDELKRYTETGEYTKKVKESDKPKKDLNKSLNIETNTSFISRNDQSVGTIARVNSPTEFTKIEQPKKSSSTTTTTPKRSISVGHPYIRPLKKQTALNYLVRIFSF